MKVDSDHSHVSGTSDFDTNRSYSKFLIILKLMQKPQNSTTLIKPRKGGDY